MLVLSSGLIPEVRQFFARIGTPSPKQRTAYRVFIEGLVKAGLWSKFDRLYVFATDTEANARINLTDNYPYPLTSGAPPFVAYTGFGSDMIGGQSGMQLDTEFVPSTAPSPRYTLNSAHLAVLFTSWTGSANGINVNTPIGAGSGTSIAYLTALGSVLQVYYGLHNAAVAVSPSIPVIGRGFLLASRTSATELTGYRDAVAMATDNTAAVAVPNQAIWVIQRNGSAGAYPADCGLCSIGAGLSQTEVSAYYSLIQGYRANTA